MLGAWCSMEGNGYSASLRLRQGAKCHASVRASVSPGQQLFAWDAIVCAAVALDSVDSYPQRRSSVGPPLAITTEALAIV